MFSMLRVKRYCAGISSWSIERTELAQKPTPSSSSLIFSISRSNMAALDRGSCISSHRSATTPMQPPMQNAAKLSMGKSLFEEQYPGWQSWGSNKGLLGCGYY
jgi:hypothetical protein